MRLAAAELRRYLFTAQVSPDLATVSSSPKALALALASGVPTYELSVAPHPTPAYILTAPTPDRVTITGSDAQHLLYGVYTFLEKIGFQFTSFGVTAPVQPLPLPVGMQQRDTPVFTTRGLQPFHDFFEGPDWWGEDEHKRVIESILSMKGNLIGFHTYPLIEPALWVGLKEQVDASGNVSGGSYSTRWATTLEEGRAWGYNAVNTSAMGFGVSQIFEHDCFGHETVSGNPLLCPSPKTPQDNDELFNRVGLLWKAAFAFAKTLGIQTALGTEIPLAMPPPPSPAPPGPGATLPLQVWYSASRNDHFITTTDCAECDNAYRLIGVTGWVYANNEAGSIPVCTYAKALPNGQIDNELAVCSGGNGIRIEGYLPATGTAGTDALLQYTNSQGHHWAVSSDWVANATAAGFSKVGAIGSVFTTGPPIPPAPDAQAYYEGIFTRLTNLVGDNLTC